MMEFKSKMGRRSDVIATNGSWRSRGLQLLMAGLPLAILATGCGATVPLHVAAVATPDQMVATPVTVDACWTDDQRVEGDDTMPQQYTQPPAMRPHHGQQFRVPCRGRLL